MDTLNGRLNLKGMGCSHVYLLNFGTGIKTKVLLTPKIKDIAHFFFNLSEYFIPLNYCILQKNKQVKCSDLINQKQMFDKFNNPKDIIFIEVIKNSRYGEPDNIGIWYDKDLVIVKN